MSVEREEELLKQQFEEGIIDASELREALKDLHNEYHWMAEEAAQEAYDREMERWG